MPENTLDHVDHEIRIFCTDVVLTGINIAQKPFTRQPQILASDLLTLDNRPGVR